MRRNFLSAGSSSITRIVGRNSAMAISVAHTLLPVNSDSSAGRVERRRRARQWQAETENSATARPVLGGDVPAVRLDDAANDRQPQPDAAPTLVRSDSEELVEDA